MRSVGVDMVVAWHRHFWRGGLRAGHSLYTAPLAPNTEAPEGWATRVCGEAGRWRAAGCWPRRGRARAERPVFFQPPRHGMGQGARSVPEYKLEREREKTLRQH